MRLSFRPAVLGYLWERRVLRRARDTPPPCTSLKNLNGSSLSPGANQSAGDSRTSFSTPPALMTAAATEPSHWEWIRRYCMMLLICSPQGNKVTVLPPFEWQKHHPSVQSSVTFIQMEIKRGKGGWGRELRSVWAHWQIYSKGKSMSVFFTINAWSSSRSLPFSIYIRHAQIMQSALVPIKVCPTSPKWSPSV